jgi:hypothetical protein
MKRRTLDPRIALLTWMIAGAAVAAAVVGTAIDRWDRR